MIVNDIEWNLVFVNPTSSFLKMADGTLTLGVTDNNTRCVYISNALKGRLLRKVITHELCHVICFSYGCDYDVDTEELIADWSANFSEELTSLLKTLCKKYDDVVISAP